jgi:hypothetical protein
MLQLPRLENGSRMDRKVLELPAVTMLVFYNWNYNLVWKYSPIDYLTSASPTFVRHEQLRAFGHRKTQSRVIGWHCSSPNFLPVRIAGAE